MAFSANWSYLVGMGLINQTGNGGGIYVAEFGSSSAIAMVTLSMTGKSGKKCVLQGIAGFAICRSEFSGTAVD